jgi:thiosulfate/3-mercaptopyruvate sulfurtransferase
MMTTLETAIQNRGYVNADKLVSTEWVAEHLNDQNIILVESNEDSLLYPSGHIPGAYEVDWTRDLNDPLRRDYLDSEQFSALLSRIGANPNSLIVLYGDKNNWWAAYTLWVFELFGHTNTKLVDGGRLKWVKEGRALSREVPATKNSNYPVKPRNDNQERAFRDQVLSHINAQGKLIDVRSPEEYAGTRLHMPDYPNEGALRGGHIPGAKSVPWAKAINPEDGTFRASDELVSLYQDNAGVAKSDDLIVYCRIGERSSHTWFVLKYLLGYDKVRNYDGSWTEWGNLVGVPIEK